MVVAIKMAMPANGTDFEETKDRVQKEYELMKAAEEVRLSMYLRLFLPHLCASARN